MAHILDGKVIRLQKEASLKSAIAASAASYGRAPGLAIVQVASLPASNTYIAQKKKSAEAVGITVTHVEIPGIASEFDVIQKINELNANPSIDGIIVQLPLPSHMQPQAVIEAISPVKDVDGLTKSNAGKLYMNDTSGLVPATARGIMSLCDYYAIQLGGKKVVVVGRSTLVGRPVALLCMHRNATVTIANRHTKNLEELCKQADIIICAAGQPELITADHVHERSIVIDVGITPVPESHEPHPDGKKITGDVAFDEVSPIVEAISPVPGGVGPMTVISLMENVVQAYEAHLTQAIS